MRHGTNGFTSLLKEGVLRIFFALKNPTASAGFEPANVGTSRPPEPLCSSKTLDLYCVGTGIDSRSGYPLTGGFSWHSSSSEATYH